MTAAPLRVVLGELDIGWHAPEAVVAGARGLAARARAVGARLLVLPEMATTGFTMDGAQAVPIDAPVVAALRAVARESSLWTIVGIALREAAATGDACAVNAALVIDPSGEIVAVHRKRRLFAFAGEDHVYQPGAEATVVAIEGVRVGVFICYELRFPELFGAVAADCDVMVVIANWPAARRAHWEALLRARAIENQAAVLGVNRTGVGGGVHYDGGSVALDAWGDPLPDVGEEGLLVADVDPAAVSRIRARYPFLRDRG